MKIFVSWSGELSKNVAQQLKKWFPVIIQASEVFFSPEDIEKGEKWSDKITSELAQCNYGIVCLTSENMNAPWINFEAGALAKVMGSKVSAFLVNIEASEIQGPLKQYQATRFDKEDMWQLINSINNVADNPVKYNALELTFDTYWDAMRKGIEEVIKGYKPPKNTEKNGEIFKGSDAVEEMLQLVRKQNELLNSPEQLFPSEYFRFLYKKCGRDDEVVFEEILRYAEKVLGQTYDLCQKGISQSVQMVFRELPIFDLIGVVLHIALGRDRYGEEGKDKRVHMLYEKYLECQKLMGFPAYKGRVNI